MSPAAAQVLASADPAFIEAAFAAIDAHPGGVAGYLQAELGLGRTEVVRLRGLYWQLS